METGKIISIVNYKGGVGKTTGAFNIGIGLSFLADKKVLLIDLDPQCSLSTMCLKAYSRRTSITKYVKDLKFDNTINYVLRSYLNSIGVFGKKTDIDLSKLIFKNFYKGYNKTLNNIDFIPATMFDDTDKSYFKGLDDLEIEISTKQTIDIGGNKELSFDLENFIKLREYAETSRISQLSLFAKFFTDFKLTEKYDYIIFDCPPSNNLITQNALIVSDYYLMPTIMDFMSSNGIVHFDSLIQNTILSKMKKTYQKAINKSEDYLKYFKKPNVKLLGVYESLRRTQVDASTYRYQVNNIPGIKNKLLDTIIYVHKGTSEATGDGYAVWSVNVEKDNYSPHFCFGALIKEILDKLGDKYDTLNITNRQREWL